MLAGLGAGHARHDAERLGYFKFEMPGRMPEQTPDAQEQAQVVCAADNHSVRVVNFANVYSQSEFVSGRLV